MSKKGQDTTTSFIEWNEFIALITRLENDKEYKFCLLISIGVFTALRISDLLTLKYSDILDGVDILEITEIKTKKVRSIKINKTLKEIVERIYTKSNLTNKEQFIFLNKYQNKCIDKSYVNVKLKEIFLKYRIKSNGNVSTHTFRKTLGRRVVELNDYSSESLVLLMQLFGHSNMGITKRYLGITKDEIHNVYDCLTF
jgi:integrase